MYSSVKILVFCLHVIEIIFTHSVNKYFFFKFYNLCLHLRQYIVKCCRLKAKKLITSNEGPDKNVIIFQPPLCFTCENAVTAVRLVDEALTEVEEEDRQVR